MRFHPLVRQHRLALCALFFVYLLTSARLVAQQPAGAGTGRTSLPDSPKPLGQTNPAVDTTARFIGYVTNPSFVFPDIAHSEGPLSKPEKFRLFVNESISPPYILVGGISAAYGQAADTPKGYGQGWDAYAERFGAQMARSSSSSFFGTFVFGTLFRQDPRFFPQNRPTFWGSVKYSAQRVFVTRTDSGRDTFDSSGILGTVAAEGLANVYLPASQQTAPKNIERVGIDLAWRFAGNMFKNYWPTLFHDMGLNRIKVIPDPGGPDAPQPKN